MSLLDWTIFFAFLAWVVYDGIRRSHKGADAAERFLAGRSAPWWMMGLSIMATQASAITMLGTTGLGWREGMRFAQFYYALPLAMVILAFTVLPLYRRFEVFTVYEYLGKRFDERTRLLAATVFLLLRGLSVGFVIYAPSVVLSAVLGLSTRLTIVAMGMIAVVYTTIGGMRAVLSTDVKQMSVMVVGLFIALWSAITALPEDVGISGATQLAEATGRLVLADWSFDMREKYTVWSALIGGTLLFLAYFGCDQSQAQRYLSGKSLRDERGALLLNAVAKVPFQMVVLFTGVVLFALYTFQAPPASFVPQHVNAALVSGDYGEAADEVAAAAIAWESARDAAHRYLEKLDDPAAKEEYRVAQERAEEARKTSIEALQSATKDQNTETNYVLPHFILTALPRGLIGLLIAAIFAAALSSIDSELNAMATVAVMDLHPRGRRRSLSPREAGRATAIAMAVLGAFATGFAFYAQGVGSLVEAVNQVGSYFYGALLGVFILAVATRRVGGLGAVSAIIAGVVVVAASDLITPRLTGEDLPFLFKNTLGTVAALATGGCVSFFFEEPPATDPRVPTRVVEEESPPTE